MAQEHRPSPEELLDRYGLRDSRLPEAMNLASANGARPRRGRLRVYQGLAAGVGKTYAMVVDGVVDRRRYPHSAPSITTGLRRAARTSMRLSERVSGRRHSRRILMFS